MQVKLLTLKINIERGFTISTPFYINSKDIGCSMKIANIISKIISDEKAVYQPIIILCIGTDRVTGDSLGPLIGHKLSMFHFKNLHIYGTLEEPIHALNIAETLKKINSMYRNPYIIAIDASLGLSSHIGFITIEKGPLSPGLGVKKDLSPVGNLAITGIVNTSGFLENMVLQTTRLSTVMHLADSIVSGIKIASRTLDNSLEFHSSF